MSSDVMVPSPVSFFELSGEYISRERHEGQNSWYVRGQNFVVVVTWAAKGEVLHEPAAPDEHAIVVPQAGVVGVDHDGDATVEAEGPALIIAPPGGIDVTMHRAGFVTRVFTARSEVTTKAINHRTDRAPDPRVATLPDVPEHARWGHVRVFPLDGARSAPGRAGQLYRTDSLMINWSALQDGPEDVDDLAVVHDDVEQVLVTLTGDYVHHVRKPWTNRMQNWRPDEHVQVTSPSVTLIGAGDVHATHAVGPGQHQLIEVFAAVRPEYVERGWILNQADYTPTEES